jgi:cation transport regulator ChaB
MDTYYASRGTAFTARTMAFTDALFQPTKQDIKTALNAAWKTYKNAMTTAKKAKKGTVQGAWSTFRTDVKACKGDLVKVFKDERGKSDLSD